MSDIDPCALADLYDTAPRVIHLVGGPADGARFAVRGDWPLRWLMPRFDLPALGPWLDAPDVHPPTVTYESYDWTRSMNDRGERTYRYAGPRG